ncbi:hypothetical protein [Paraburkholderia heleia]|nr:hypothetical protein [Paraburkholderia heleia]
MHLDRAVLHVEGQHVHAARREYLYEPDARQLGSLSASSPHTG